MNVVKRWVRAAVAPRWRDPLRMAAGRLRAPLYRGTKRFCPICEGRFRKFLPAGVDRRPDARCPRCGSAERHRLLWLYLQDRTDVLNPERQLRILHVAPEPLLARKLSALPGIDYVSGDLAGIGMMQFDVTRLPFDDRSFDVVLCLHVLEHVPDDLSALREFARVLRGWGILQVPVFGGRTIEDPSVTDPRERLRRFGQEDHVRMYGRDYEERLRVAGFDVLVDDYVRQLPVDLVTRCRLDRDEDLYVVRPKQDSQLDPRASS